MTCTRNVSVCLYCRVYQNYAHLKFGVAILPSEAGLGPVTDLCQLVSWEGGGRAGVSGGFRRAGVEDEGELGQGLGQLGGQMLHFTLEYQQQFHTISSLNPGPPDLGRDFF